MADQEDSFRHINKIFLIGKAGNCAMNQYFYASFENAKDWLLCLLFLQKQGQTNKLRYLQQ
jgi:hypothetical protein